MTHQKLKSLLREAYAAKCTVQRFSQIQIELGDEARILTDPSDASSFEHLLDVIMLNGGRRRNTNEVIALYPVIFALCGDRNGTRLADICKPTEF